MCHQNQPGLTAQQEATGSFRPLMIDVMERRLVRRALQQLVMDLTILLLIPAKFVTNAVLHHPLLLMSRALACVDETKKTSLTLLLKLSTRPQAIPRRIEATISPQHHQSRRSREKDPQVIIQLMKVSAFLL